MQICVYFYSQSKFAVSFPHHTKIINALRSVPGRQHWEREKKLWYIPKTKTAADSLLIALYRTGMFNYESRDQEALHTADVQQTIFEDALDKLKKELRFRRYAKNTTKIYEKQLRTFFYRTGYNPESLKKDDIVLYFEKLNRYIGISRSYIVQSLSALKLFFGIAYPAHGNPAKNIPLPKKERRLLLMLVYSTGLRVGEVVILQLKDLDFDRKMLHIRQSKGRKDRYVMLSEHIRKAYLEYRKYFVVRDWLFPGANPDNHISIRTTQKVFDNAVENAGIKKGVSIHSLRHAFATHLLESGVL